MWFFTLFTLVSNVWISEKEREQQTSDLDMQIRRKELDEKIEKLSQQCAKTDKKLPEVSLLYTHLNHFQNFSYTILNKYLLLYGHLIQNGRMVLTFPDQT